MVGREESQERYATRGRWKPGAFRRRRTPVKKFVESTGKFCDRLVAARVREGLTLQQLADKAGLGKPRVVKLENGYASPSVDDVRRLTRALNCEADYLLATRPGLDDAHADQHLRHRARNPRLIPDA